MKIEKINKDLTKSQEKIMEETKQEWIDNFNFSHFDEIALACCSIGYKACKNGFSLTEAELKIKEIFKDWRR